MSDAGTVPQPTSSLEGKDGRLEVLSAKPLVLQTPLELLAGRRITETAYLYVRNVEDLPDAMTIRPIGLGDWAVEVGGLIGRSPLAIPATDLVDMDQVEVEMVLQCSGNGRTRFGGAPGTPWGLGGVGNVRFAGVPLSAVLDRWGIRVDPRATFVTAGSRATGTGRAPDGFEHSLPAADVLDRSILALRLNGDPLPGVHGGPVRLVTPGYFGTMQVKWLDRLRFETAESTGFFHATEYRVPLSPAQPGEPFQFTLENSRPTWLLQLTSFIVEPVAGSTLTAGPVTVSGFAFNDGAARLASVEVSVDRGVSWRSADAGPARQSLRVGPMDDRDGPAARHARDLVARDGPSRAHPAPGRQGSLEPERLRMEWRREGRGRGHRVTAVMAPEPAASGLAAPQSGIIPSAPLASGQAVRRLTLDQEIEGSNPSSPANTSEHETALGDESEGL